MSHRASQPAGKPDSPPRRTGGAWAVVAILLAVGIIVPLLVPLYDSETPTLIGFPFFFWFQFALIPVVSALTYTAFRLSLRATEKDRPTFGLPAEENPQDRGSDD